MLASSKPGKHGCRDCLLVSMCGQATSRGTRHIIKPKGLQRRQTDKCQAARTISAGYWTLRSQARRSVRDSRTGGDDARAGSRYEQPRPARQGGSRLSTLDARPTAAQFTRTEAAKRYACKAPTSRVCEPKIWSSMALIFMQCGFSALTATVQSCSDLRVQCSGAPVGRAAYRL